jgi:hypothetical protein
MWGPRPQEGLVKELPMERPGDKEISKNYENRLKEMEVTDATET